MRDEPIDYDLARPFVTHISIYKQQPTSELPKGGSVFASCTTNLELEESDALIDLTSAIAKSKDAVWVNFEGMDDKMKAIYGLVDPVFRQLGTNLKKSLALLRWRYGLTDQSNQFD